MKTLNTNAKNLANKKSIVIARNDGNAKSRKEIFVIASKSQDLRGNLQCNIDKIDCHDSTLRAESRNDIENSFNDANHFVIASKSQDLRGTSPQLRSSDSARKREWAQLRKQNLQCNIDKIDCHANANAFARNDKKTHPQTPSAREGVLRGVATLAREGAYFGLPRATSCARNDGVISPSLAEGARGWVSFDSTADIVGKDSASVIASERSERGNLQYNIESVDCHEFASANSRNDKKKHLAMSIAASAIIASLSIDSLVAGCSHTGQANHMTTPARAI